MKKFFKKRKKENDIQNEVVEKKKANKLFITFIILDILVAGCFFLTYGPINYFRDFVITTAMTSHTHRYLARTFYSNDTINEVLSKNTISTFETGSDTSLVSIGDIEEGNYASAYEKEIKEHAEGEEFKLIRFQYKGYNYFLVAIYDPTRVSLMQSAYIGYSGQTLRDMSASNGAQVAINAGGFFDADSSGIPGTGNGGIPAGVVIKDGRVVYGSGYTNTHLAGFNNEGILMLSYSNGNQAIANGMKDGVEFGPFLIVNGVSASISGNGGWGINPRTVLAQRQDGIVLFLVVDGNAANKYNWSGRGGATMSDLLVILERYGAYNAVNMDGGASSTMVMNNQLINAPCGYSATGERRLPNGWMFK